MRAKTGGTYNTGGSQARGVTSGVTKWVTLMWFIGGSQGGQREVARGSHTVGSQGGGHKRRHKGRHKGIIGGVTRESKRGITGVVIRRSHAWWSQGGQNGGHKRVTRRITRGSHGGHKGVHVCNM